MNKRDAVGDFFQKVVPEVIALTKRSLDTNVVSVPWDKAAAVFIGQQTGCIITRVDGPAWALSAGNVTMAIDKDIQRVLTSAYCTSFDKTEGDVS